MEMVMAWRRSVPAALIEGVAALAVRAGLALPVVLSDHVLLLPTGGASFIGAVGQGGCEGVAGASFGLGVIRHEPGAVGFRAGITWHRFASADGAIWLLEFGFVSP
jgi:hypothetical protein